MKHSLKQNLYLTEQQCKQYDTEGFVIVRKLFSKNEILEITRYANLLKEIAFKLANNMDDKVMHKGTQFVISHKNKKPSIDRIVWAGAIEPRLLEFGRLSKITYPVAQLLKAQYADHLINQLHYKLPNDGIKFGWHIDLQNRIKFDPNWNDVGRNGSFVQVITAIDEHNISNGPLRVIPGIDKNGPPKFPYMCDDLELPKTIDINQSIMLLLSPGDTVFLHPWIPHSSLPNKSAIERKTFLNGFSLPEANKKPYPGVGSAEKIYLNKGVTT